MAERGAEKGKPKRYNMVMPQVLWEEVSRVSQKRGTSVAETLRMSVRLGLEIERALDNGGKLIKRVGDKDTELLLI